MTPGINSLDHPNRNSHLSILWICTLSVRTAAPRSLSVCGWLAAIKKPQEEKGGKGS